MVDASRTDEAERSSSCSCCSCCECVGRHKGLGVVEELARIFTRTKASSEEILLAHGLACSSSVAAVSQPHPHERRRDDRADASGREIDDTKALELRNAVSVSVATCFRDDTSRRLKALRARTGETHARARALEAELRDAGTDIAALQEQLTRSISMKDDLLRRAMQASAELQLDYESFAKSSEAFSARRAWLHRQVYTSAQKTREMERAATNVISKLNLERPLKIQTPSARGGR